MYRSWPVWRVWLDLRNIIYNKEGQVQYFCGVWFVINLRLLLKVFSIVLYFIEGSGACEYMPFDIEYLIIACNWPEVRCRIVFEDGKDLSFMKYWFLFFV